MSHSPDDVRRQWHAAGLAPLWESPNAHRAQEDFVPSRIWRWDETRPLIELAFQQTSPAAVQRRVLQMISPRARSIADEHTCGNVLAAFQCLLPGETARPHRHTMNALRFMLEGSGAVTLVDGKECPMEFGDLVITPGMTWHEHRHEGGQPVVWLDVLDVPLHMSLGSAVFEPGPMVRRPDTTPDDAFACPGVLPEVVRGRTDHSPMYRYPYADTLRVLAHAPASADRLLRVRYVNPLSGGNAVPLLDSSMVRLPAQVRSLPARTNANQVITVVAGEGESVVGGQAFRWRPRDVFTVPQHQWAHHQALEGDATFFVVSDADVYRRLGVLTQEVGPEGT